MKYVFIRDHRGAFPVSTMCQTLEVGRSGFYAWLNRLESPRSLENWRLLMAIKEGGLKSGLIHHSDRGVQYTSNEFQALLKANAIQCSMSRKGNCWDNAVAESFFHTLKVELLRGKINNTRQEAKTAIFEYIEVFYNRERRHSYLGYLSPGDFEKQYAA